MSQGVQAFKVSQIDKIHDWLPRRKTICIGDSTQSDPEAYAEIYRKYPGWVKAIFIRRVVGVYGGEAVIQRNSDARFLQAFKGIPRSVWKVFESTDELNEAVEALQKL